MQHEFGDVGQGGDDDNDDVGGGGVFSTGSHETMQRVMGNI